MTTVRRFEPGFCTDLYGLQDFLGRHGYDLRAKYLSGFTITGKGTSVKTKKWTGVVEFVDGIRVKCGLEPIRRAS